MAESALRRERKGGCTNSKHGCNKDEVKEQFIWISFSLQKRKKDVIWVHQKKKDIR